MLLPPTIDPGNLRIPQVEQHIFYLHKAYSYLVPPKRTKKHDDYWQRREEELEEIKGKKAKKPEVGKKANKPNIAMRALGSITRIFI